MNGKLITPLLQIGWLYVSKNNLLYVYFARNILQTNCHATFSTLFLLDFYRPILW